MKQALITLLVTLYALSSVTGASAVSIESNQITGHGGDCGYELYPVSESGAGGYCYTSQAGTMQSLTVTVAEPVKHDEPETEPAPSCVTVSEYHPCENH